MCPHRARHLWETEKGFVLQPWACQKHVSPRKQCFLKILIYTTDCIQLEKSIFSILKNQGTQPRSQVMVQTKDTQQRKTFLSCL
jgi:hypothetical protein